MTPADPTINSSQFEDAFLFGPDENGLGLLQFGQKLRWSAIRRITLKLYHYPSLGRIALGDSRAISDNGRPA